MLKTILAVAAGYVAASETAMHLLRVSGDAPMVWIASAVGLVGVLLAGPCAAVGVALGAFAAGLLGGTPLVNALGSSALTTGQILLAWWLMRRVVNMSNSLARIEDVLALLLIGATVIPLTSVARELIFDWWHPGLVTPQRLGLVQITALGEAIGIVLLVPPALAWAHYWRAGPRQRTLAEAWLLYGTTLLVSVTVFSGQLASTMSAESLPYALFPLTFWAALRLDMRHTASVLLLAGGIAISYHSMGFGPFIMPSVAPEQTFAQYGSLYLFLAVLSVTSLLAAAAQRQREDAEAQVRESEQRYRMLIEGMNEGVNITDADARMTFVSDRFCEMTGYSRAELLGRTGEQLTLPELDETWRESHRLRQAGRSQSHPLTLKRKDGQLLHVWISPRPQFDANGAYLGSLNVVLDITDRRRAEDKAREHLDQLAHVARVASMGEMASAIAHEINQPLTAIANYANASLRLLRAGNITPEEMAETMQRLATEAERAGAVVRKMRGFVRAEEGHPQAVPVEELFADVLRLTGAEARQYEAEVSAQDANSLPDVLVDTIQIQQVLLNLVRNAAEAMASAGSPERRIVLAAERNAGGMIEITVTDTGPGLPQFAADKVFEPFYTTKAEGIGIGLALSRSIVDAHGGRLWAEAAGPGAAFHLTLPIAEELSDAEP